MKKLNFRPTREILYLFDQVEQEIQGGIFRKISYGKCITEAMEKSLISEVDWKEVNKSNITIPDDAKEISGKQPITILVDEDFTELKKIIEQAICLEGKSITIPYTIKLLLKNFILKNENGVEKKIKIEFLKDKKEETAIERIMKFYNEINVLEYESKDSNIEIYKKLGWSNSNNFDVISSFWTTFTYAMHYEFSKIYKIAEKGNVKIYKTPFSKGGFYIPSFTENFSEKNSEERRQVLQVCDTFDKLNDLASFTHCVANFMPSPQGFNEAKGCANECKDYLPLMVDKIQQCIERKECLYYGDNKQVSLEVVEQWHVFLIENRKKYSLEMYYTVEQEILKGIPFFQGQSLGNPVPNKKEEIKECLLNMTERIIERAERLKEQIVKSLL